MLAASPERYDHVLLVDDDVDLPAGFLDRFLDIQRSLGFALAQPARSIGSPADHPIVLQQPGALARRTLFVEVGPVLSIARSALDAVLPFDLRSSMGWGYEAVWSHRLGERSAIGIIDATPVDHRLRPTAAHYAKSAREAEQRHPPGRRRPPSTRRVHALSSKSTPSPVHDPPQHPPVAFANERRWCPRCLKSS